MRRIIPISSGKGGVGKTTFAINFALALSQRAPTVLVDLDTGTSSVRNTLATSVDKDLYHFHKKGAPLIDCVNQLDDKLDPDGAFRHFGFIPAPRHFIDEIANPQADLRRRIAEEINRLPAEYVVVDLRAGLDDQVLDFLPFTNSGILVVAPHHPAATLAASDIVKAILFRTLRLLFAENGKFFEVSGLGQYHNLVHDLLGRVEDVYDPSIANLDAFLVELGEAFGRHPILSVISETLESFRVCYVLNMFDGVEESYQEALVPFVRNLSENVSSRLHLTQLGWVVKDDRLHRSNSRGVPVLLEAEKRKMDPVSAELQSFEQVMLGLRRRRPRKNASSSLELGGASDDLLAGELATLSALYTNRKSDTVRENFRHLVFRALNLMTPPTSPTEFGQKELFSPEQLTDWFLDWKRNNRHLLRRR